MKVSKAPSWPAIIISGLAGGAVKWYFDSSVPGILVFALLSSLSILLRKNKQKTAKA